jgi:hypothetical protein
MLTKVILAVTLVEEECRASKMVKLSGMILRKEFQRSRKPRKARVDSIPLALTLALWELAIMLTMR